MISMDNNQLESCLSKMNKLLLENNKLLLELLNLNDSKYSNEDITRC